MNGRRTQANRSRSEACSRRDIGSHRSEVVRDLARRFKPRHLAVLDTIAPAKLPSDTARGAQSRSRHRWEQMVLDVVVDASEQKVMQPRCAEISSDGRSRAGRTRRCDGIHYAGTDVIYEEDHGEVWADQKWCRSANSSALSASINPKKATGGTNHNAKCKASIPWSVRVARTIAPQMAEAIQLQCEPLQPHQDPDQGGLVPADVPAEPGLAARRRRMHAEELRLHIRIPRPVVAVRVMASVDIAEMRMAKRREQSVEDLTEPVRDTAVAKVTAPCPAS